MLSEGHRVPGPKYNQQHDFAFPVCFFPQREENRLFVLNPLSTWLDDSYEDTKGGGEPEGCIV